MQIVKQSPASSPRSSAGYVKVTSRAFPRDYHHPGLVRDVGGIPLGIFFFFDGVKSKQEAAQAGRAEGYKLNTMYRCEISVAMWSPEEISGLLSIPGNIVQKRSAMMAADDAA